MPLPPRLWRHVIVSTKNTWFHGDDRGFRDRSYRIHSSGDYKRPPPEDEHPGLHRHFEERAGEEVVFEPSHLPVVGRALVTSLKSMTYHPACVAVASVHAHVLVQLTNDYDLIKRVGGKAKLDASRAISGSLQGEVWAAGGTLRMIKDDRHRQNVYDYILYEQRSGTWTWSMEDTSEDGVIGRVRPSQ